MKLITSIMRSSYSVSNGRLGSIIGLDLARLLVAVAWRRRVVASLALQPSGLAGFHLLEIACFELRVAGGEPVVPPAVGARRGTALQSGPGPR